MLDQLFNVYYGSLTPCEMENLKHKINLVLESYLKIKDLLIHDVRNIINYIHGKWSIDSFDRLVKINVDTFTDILNVGKFYKIEFSQTC